MFCENRPNSAGVVGENPNVPAVLEIGRSAGLSKALHTEQSSYFRARDPPVAFLTPAGWMHNDRICRAAFSPMRCEERRFRSKQFGETIVRPHANHLDRRHRAAHRVRGFPG